MPGRLPGRVLGPGGFGGNSGAPPALLPLVAMVAVNSITSTGATLVGSVNPQGLSGSWWFVYGTTPQFGSTAPSSSQPIAATSIPQTVSVAIAGLTTGATYYAAVVGFSSGGTVTSAPISFVAQVAQPVTNASNVPAPLATPQVLIPHWKFPFTFTASGGVGVVEQDTIDEVASNVATILACETGACPELPTFGRPDLTFGTAPLSPQALVAALQRQEPRASIAAVSQALGDPNAGSWQINLTTQYAGGGR